MSTESVKVDLKSICLGQPSKVVHCHSPEGLIGCSSAIFVMVDGLAVQFKMKPMMALSPAPFAYSCPFPSLNLLLKEIQEENGPGVESDLYASSAPRHSHQSV